MPVHATLLHASTIAPPPPPFDERQLRPPFSFTTDINSLGPIFGGRTDPISGGRTDDLVSASPTMINAAQPTLLMNVLDDVYELHDAAPSKWRHGGMGIMGAVDDHGFFGGMMVDSIPTTTSALPSPIRNAEGHAVDFRLAAPLKEVKCPPRTHPVGARPAHTPPRGSMNGRQHGWLSHADSCAAVRVLGACAQPVHVRSTVRFRKKYVTLELISPTGRVPTL